MLRLRSTFSIQCVPLGNPAFAGKPCGASCTRRCFTYRVGVRHGACSRKGGVGLGFLTLGQLDIGFDLIWAHAPGRKRTLAWGVIFWPSAQVVYDFVAPFAAAVTLPWQVVGSSRLETAWTDNVRVCIATAYTESPSDAENTPAEVHNQESLNVVALYLYQGNVATEAPWSAPTAPRTIISYDLNEIHRNSSCVHVVATVTIMDQLCRHLCNAQASAGLNHMWV